MKLRNSYFKVNYILFFVTTFLAITGTAIVLLFAYLLQALVDIAKGKQVIVLKEGKIVEKGRYEVLISNKDYFYSLLNTGIF